MKFLNVLFLATMAMAAPKMEARQQQTVSGTVISAITNLESSTRTNVRTIEEALQTIRQSTEVTIIVQLEGTLRANYRAILSAIQVATRDIVSVTTGSAGGLAGSVRGLTQQEVDNLTQSVYTLITALSNIRAVLTVTVTDLRPSTQQLIASEVNAIRSVLEPFLNPVVAYYNTVRNFGASVGLEITGLNGVLQSLYSTVNSLTSSLGLPSIPGTNGA
ncbi:hypothetical protein B0I35DRAFT_477817 [Stachybotrys elegans]|uniref:Uncharacterized protein n=1 Tax=Stachybotrys elegans TaxID=80388 RepID=A0A8K0WTM1_9HYPO|nr:hypothetical protein B0I35DRAFT_477817 [Stachybotrys elegans]